MPSERTSPSCTLNAVIGALVGFVLAAAVVILHYMLDDKISEDEYLTQTYPNIPLLAVVPDMASTANKGCYQYSSEPTGERTSEKPSSRKRKIRG